MGDGVSDVRVRLHGEKLEYILAMTEQLADMACGIDERQLGGALWFAVKARRRRNRAEATPDC